MSVEKSAITNTKSGERRSSSSKKLVLPLVIEALTPRTLQLLLLSCIFPTVKAQSLTPARCNSTGQNGFYKPGEAFNVQSWLNRGSCVRGNGNYAQCQENLRFSLSNLDSIHSAEYGAASGVLALLPTIGAVFGTPNSEIWELLTLLPLGGSLAMILSFGSTLMPDRVEEYENAFSKNSIHGIRFEKRSNGRVEDYDFLENGDIVPNECKSADDTRHKDLLELLSKKIRVRLNQRNRQGLSRWSLVLGLFAMILLFAGVQMSMGIVEYGAVYSDDCTFDAWFHAWYVVVTFVAVLDNWVRLPFEKHWKLYVTSIPYDIQIIGGESIDAGFDQNDTISKADICRVALKQLSSIKPAILQMSGSSLTTKNYNSMLVLVSITRDQENLPKWRYALQIFTKCASVTVFVFGTCIFSAVTLLAMPMAQMVVVLIVAAGIGSRFITGGIVSEIAKAEPMMHVVANEEQEAMEAIAQIFELQQKPDMHFQVEVEGQIFIDGKRVGQRSQWYRRILGVLAGAYDLRKVKPYSMSDEE